jgi:hypothetical protein
MRDIAAKLRDELHSKGISVAPGSAIESFDNNDQQNTGTKVQRLLNKHSSSIGNLFTALAGAFIAMGARRSDDPATRRVDTLLGLSTLTAGTTAALVKEKVPDPDKPKPTGFFARVGNWIQERPNRIAGIGYGFSSLAHAYEVLTNIRSAKTDYATPAKIKQAYWAYGMRGGFVMMNLLAEGVLSFASKGGGTGVKSDKGVDETAYALVADTISRQPVAMREQLYKDLSRNFLAKPEVLGGDAEDIEAALRARVKKLGSNPWAGDGVIPDRAAGHSLPAQENSQWRGKITASQQQLSPAASPAL